MVAYGKAMRPSLVDVMEELNAGGGGSYTLPTASADTLGGVKVGSGLAIDSDGVLSASGGSGGSDDSLFLTIQIRVDETQGVDNITWTFAKNGTEQITSFNELHSFVENYPMPIYITTDLHVNSKEGYVSGYGTIQYIPGPDMILIIVNAANNNENIHVGISLGFITANDEITRQEYAGYVSITEINSSAITDIYRR